MASGTPSGWPSPTAISAPWLPHAPGDALQLLAHPREVLLLLEEREVLLPAVPVEALQRRLELRGRQRVENVVPREPRAAALEDAELDLLELSRGVRVGVDHEGLIQRNRGGELNNAIQLEIELKGLGSAGPDTEGRLRRAILGYYREDLSLVPPPSTRGGGDLPSPDAIP